MSGPAFEPSYIQTYRQGFLYEKIKKAYRLIQECSLCPRNCGVNRFQEKNGFCQAGYWPEVSSCAPHFGEERPLVGSHGSGTIFMTHCNLKCLYCQNFPISHKGEGEEISFDKLSQMMLHLQNLGCHNINFVSPSHYVPQILKSLPPAIEKGLSVPLVFNTGGYDSVETLKLLDGVFDIYMPDFKYAESRAAERCSGASDYPQVARMALKEMFRQVGDLYVDDRGVAVKGLLVRHLVLPQELAHTPKIMHFLSTEISKNTYVNIMDQYYPCGNISSGSPLQRRISRREFKQAVESAQKEGLSRLDKKHFRLF